MLIMSVSYLSWLNSLSYTGMRLSLKESLLGLWKVSAFSAAEIKAKEDELEY